MTEPDDFDAERLRRLDRPHRPTPDADARIRAAMFDAFDDAVEDESADTEGSGLTLVDGTGADRDPAVVELDLRRRADEHPDAEGRATTRRWPYLATVAAVLLLVVGAVVLRDGDDAPEINVAEQNEAAVAGFCDAEFNPLIDAVVDFHSSTGGELAQRALRNLELLSQAYDDVALELSGPLQTQVDGAGDEFLQRAADIRRMASSPGSGDTAATIRVLATDLATAVEALPGSAGCRTADLRGD